MVTGDLCRTCTCIKKYMEDGNLAKNYEPADDEEAELLESFNLLTYKPVIYAANVAEEDLADDAAGNSNVSKVREYAKNEGSEVFVICAQIGRASCRERV